MQRLLHRDWLDSHFNFEARAGKIEGVSLDRAIKLFQLLGNPQHQYRAIHLTGTNGKGSTAHILTQLLMATGLKTGTYSSPHLVHLNERYQINGVFIKDSELDEILGDLKALEQKNNLFFSWFELATAVAYIWFAKQNIDVAIVEVGKLGRYDATNVIDGEVCVVTNIGKDHIDNSMDTNLDMGQKWQKAIAWEKAGIITRGSKLVLGNIEPHLQEIFAAEGAAEVYVLGEDLLCSKNEKSSAPQSGRNLDITMFPGAGKSPEKYEDLFLSMHGAHQGVNATLALGAAKAFLENLNKAHTLTPKNVAYAFSRSSLAARFEVLCKEPLIILDGGHNPDGARAARLALEDFLDNFLDNFLGNGADAKSSQDLSGLHSTLIVGLTDDKTPSEMLTALKAQTFSRVIFTNLSNPRGKDPYELVESTKSLGIDSQVIETPADALDFAKTSDLVFICGSLYLAGDIKRTYKPQLLERNYSGV